MMSEINDSIKLALVVDSFYPSKTSIAIQMFDLAKEMVDLGVEVTIFVPDEKVAKGEFVETYSLSGIDVVHVRSGKIKNVNYVVRAFREILMPWQMILNLKRSNYSLKNWDGVVWYSPSIFISFFATYLAKVSAAKTYLILRDIFPQWALDVGLLSKGPAYYFFRMVEKYQYRSADRIGVQAAGDVGYFESENLTILDKVEVLNNWRTKPVMQSSRSLIKNSLIAGREIFIYSGNIGAAQNLYTFVEAAEVLMPRKDIGFLFIGGGSEKDKIRDLVKSKKLDNFVVLDEIAHEDLPSLYLDCRCGIISLDINLSTHNIPGKFLSYLYSGLPVIANINPGNDLETIVNKYEVGRCISTIDPFEIARQIVSMVDTMDSGNIRDRCEALVREQFSSRNAAIQVLKSFDAWRN
jgi:hypothetical protein